MRIPQLNRFQRVAPEAFFVVSGQVVGAAGNIFAIRILTTLLPPAGYGQLALAMTGAVLAQQLVLGPIGTACVRYFAPAQESGEVGTYARAVAWMFLAGSVALGIVALGDVYKRQHLYLLFCQWPIPIPPLS